LGRVRVELSCRNEPMPSCAVACGGGWSMIHNDVVKRAVAESGHLSHAPRLQVSGPSSTAVYHRSLPSRDDVAAAAVMVAAKPRRVLTSTTWQRRYVRSCRRRCTHSSRNTMIAHFLLIFRIVCAAGSMKRSSVRPSVRLSIPSVVFDNRHLKLE